MPRLPALAVLLALAITGPALANAPSMRAEVESALRSNNPEQLAQTLKKLNQASGDSFELSFQRGLIHLKREQYDAAMASFSVIPTASAHYFDARNNMAAIYAAQGKFTEAKHTLEEALKTQSALALVYTNLNNLKAHLASKNYASAVQLLEPGKSGKLALVVSTGAIAAEPPRMVKQDKGVPEAKDSKAPEAVAARPAPVASAAPVALSPAPAVAALPAASGQERPNAAKAPQPSAASGEEAELTRAAVQALQEWAQAWEKKDMERYLKAYAPDFTPADGKSHAQWVKDRQARILSKGSIKIQLKQIEPTLLSKTLVKLRYRQLYQSDQLKVSSDKTIEMKWIGQQWLITSERASEGGRK